MMIAKKSLTKQSNRKPYPKFNIDVESLLWLPNNLGFFWKDLEGHYLGCNDRAAELAGFDSRHSVVGASDFDLSILYEEAKALRAGDIQVINEGKPSQFDYICTHSEYILTILTFKAPLLNADGKIAGVYGIDNFLAIQHLTSSLNSLEEAGVPINDIQSTLNTKISSRQQECLFYLIHGMTIKEISKTLNLSPRTVEHYLDASKDKLGCKTRSELISKALQLSFIKSKLFK